MNGITNALWISLLGMGLVFAAILLLWGLMSALVRVFADRPSPDEASQDASSDTVQPVKAPEKDQELLARRKKAAAAAVAVARVINAEAAPQEARSEQPKGFFTSIKTGSSAGSWQTIQRASQLSQRVFRPAKKVQR